MSLYFSENEPFAAEWICNLYPGATVDKRSIVDVKATDLAGFRRVHLFAGAGTWEHALHLAGFDGPCWTGSCPCQPFSSAGKHRGTADERHLWPEMFRLIRECRPGLVFGEQVASRTGLGWLDGVFSDLEGEGYTCRAADCGAAGLGAPHIRQRLYWVGGLSDAGGNESRAGQQPAGSGTVRRVGTGEPGRLDLPAAPRRRRRTGEAGQEGREGIGRGVLADASSNGRMGQSTILGDWAAQVAGSSGPREAERRERGVGGPGASGPWSNFTIIPCGDGKARRMPLPGSLGVAYGLADDVVARCPGRVEAIRTCAPLTENFERRAAILRVIGNGIIPQVAAGFIRAVMDAIR